MNDIKIVKCPFCHEDVELEDNEDIGSIVLCYFCVNEFSVREVIQDDTK